MKKCFKCNKDFEPSKGLLNFCTIQCRNSRVFSKEAIALKVAKATTHYQNLPEEQKLEIQQKLKALRSKRQPTLDRLFKSDFALLTWDSKRARVIVEQKFKCNKCQLDTWLDKPITIEIDHIDGNNKNNSRENLEGLCPNCHAQTDTWRGKHKNNKDSKLNRLLRLKQS